MTDRVLVRFNFGPPQLNADALITRIRGVVMHSVASGYRSPKQSNNANLSTWLLVI